MLAKGPGAKKRDPERTRENILDVATEEFATLGLDGGRIDAIAEKTQTSKRMIYYYFESKEGLYLAVLERAYRRIRTRESDLRLNELPPEKALRELISTTFDNDENDPVFVRLVSIENIHYAAHMRRSDAIRELNISVIESIGQILERGNSSGIFKRAVDPVDIHMMISALCFFRVSNKHTFGTIFQRDLSAPDIVARHKAMIADAVVGYLTNT